MPIKRYNTVWVEFNPQLVPGLVSARGIVIHVAHGNVKVAFELFPELDGWYPVSACTLTKEGE